MSKPLKYCIGLFAMLLQTILTLNAQDSTFQTATVEKVLGVPVFIYSEPVNAYEILGKADKNMEIIQMDMTDYTNADKKAMETVESTDVRKKTGKIKDYDAIIVDIGQFKSFAIRFTSEKSLKARVNKVRNIYIFFFSKPDKKYDVIAHLPAKFPKYEENGLLTDKVNSMINRSLRKVKSGEINKFDGLIFNPKDFTATAIKFK